MGVLIASIPSGHVYVRHLDAPGGSDRVVRLPDPPVADGSPAARWWPPAMLEPEWVRAHADEFDIMHIHFGFDHQPPDTLRQLVGALRRHRKPLVLTVHDLRNPHHGEPELHDAQLGVLVSAADAVITLTPGAAAEIRRRWGRTATVLPHPHVVEEPTLSRRRRRARPLRHRGSREEPARQHGPAARHREDRRRAAEDAGRDASRGCPHRRHEAGGSPPGAPGRCRPRPHGRPGSHRPAGARLLHG